MKHVLSSQFIGKSFFIFNLILAASARSAPGDLDISFAGTGKSRIGFGGGYDLANAVSVQADGKIVVAGSATTQGYTTGADSFALARFQTNGVLDPAFGDGGKVMTTVNTNAGSGYAAAEATAVQIQPDGKIVAAGYAYHGTNSPYSSFALVRYNPDGSVDTTFGTNGNGIVYTDFADGAQIRAMAIQSDGKIVVAGYTLYPGGNAGERAVALARYATNGALDLSFGSGGIQITTGVVGYTGAHGLMIQPDEKILAVGIGIGPGHNGTDFALYRYTTNGILDSSFGGGSGKVFTAITTNVVVATYMDYANAAATFFGDETVLHPNKIVVAGYYWNMGASAIYQALARYNLDGTLDSSFGNNGIVTNYNSSGDYMQALIVQGFGTLPHKITVAGYNQSGTNTLFVLTRYTGTGALDTTFGTNATGRVTFSFGAYHNDQANGMAGQSGNFILAGSTAVNDNNRDFAAVRFTPNGVLDPTFGTGGVATADIADRDSQAKGAAIQPDGRIVVAGSAEDGSHNIFALARYNVDGSLDNTFGAAGKVKTRLGVGDNANATAIQADGKIVAVGSTSTGPSNYFAVVRYNTDGSLDGSFAAGGIASTPFTGNDDSANALIFQVDGKIIVAGSSRVAANNHDFALARYNTNGTLDMTFNGTGKVLTAIASGEDIGQSVKLQADGKIIVGGTAHVGASDDFALVRYNTNGTLDNSFGSFGRVATDFNGGSTDGAFAAAIQPDGKIIEAGYSLVASTVYLALARYTTNGTLDNSFGVGGKVTTQIGLVADYATSLALQSDGKIVASGISQIGGLGQYAIVRYISNGSLDGSFGIGGKVVTDFGDGGNDYSWAVALDSLGRMVLAGSANSRFGVARFLGDPFLKILSIAPLGNGHVALTGLGVPNSSHTVNATTNLTPGSFIPLGPVTPDSTGFWQFEDSGAVGVNRRFYRLSFP